MKKRTDFLDGLRFILALTVAIGHFYNFIGGRRVYHIPLIGGMGAVAVDGFIIITGFLMMYNYILRENTELYNSPKTFKRFWMRRLFRLYPVYLIAILIAYLLFPLNNSQQIWVLQYFNGNNINAWGSEVVSKGFPNISDLLSHLTVTHGLVPQYASGVLGSAWSLSLEMQFYLLFPFIVLTFFQNKNKLLIKYKAILLYIFALVTSIILCKNNFYGLPSTILHRLPLFLFGMMLAMSIQKKIKSKYLVISLLTILPYELILDLKQNWATCIIIVFIVVMMYLDDMWYNKNRKGYLFLNHIRLLLSNRVSKFGANISYSLYLMHLLIIPFVYQISIKVGMMINLSKFAIIAVAFIIFICVSLLLCNLIYIYIEKPFIKLGRNLISQKTESNKNVIIY